MKIYKPEKISNYSLGKSKMKPVKSQMKPIPLKNLSWSQAKVRFPNMKPFGDADKDGLKNFKDCKPFDRKRQHKVKTDRCNHSYTEECEFCEEFGTEIHPLWEDALKEKNKK